MTFELVGTDSDGETLICWACLCNASTNFSAFLMAERLRFLIAFSGPVHLAARHYRPDLEGV